jgi:glycolate oxidase
MVVSSEAICKSMEEIVSKEYVSGNIYERIKNAIDPFPYEVTKEQVPYATVMPGDTQQVAEIVKFANANRIPVFVKGSGTHLGGASRPHKPGIVLSTHRLNRIEIFEEYGFVECGAGCTCANVAQEVEKRGYFLPMAPGSRLVATMGGLVSNNTSGHIIDTSIGKPGDYVYGLEVVLPTGEIIETGTMGLRRPAGTEMTKFFVGGDGLLGVITKVRMRLLPYLKRGYGVVVFEDAIALARGVQRMYMEKRPAPLLMEFLDRKTAKVGFTIKGLDPPPGAVIFFVATGNTQEEAAGKINLILQSFRAENPQSAEMIDDIELWNKLWSAREVIGTFLMQEGKQWSAAEVVSNLKDLPECMMAVQHFNEGLPIFGQLELFIFGHIGALTFHPGVLIPREWDNDKKRQAVNERFQRETELNLKYRTCGGEWGQFSKRKDFWIQRYGEVSYELVKKMKGVFDPNNILNPGILEGYR